MIHDIRPPFKRDALENGEHGKAEVVEVCDAEIGADPAVPALHVLADRRAVEPIVQVARVGGIHDLIWKFEHLVLCLCNCW